MLLVDLYGDALAIVPDGYFSRRLVYGHLYSIHGVVSLEVIGCVDKYLIYKKAANLK